MLDRPMRRLIDPPLDWLAASVAAWGVSANAITLSGFAIGLASSVCLATQFDPLALTLLILNRVADGLDGAVARRLRATDVGGYLDIVLDFIWYSSVPFAFAVRDPNNALAAAFLIYSFIGTGGSFLASATIAAQRRAPPSAKKSFVYSLGLIEGTETIAFFLAFCLWPQHFAVLAWIFGGLCWITTLLRIISSVREFRENPS